VQPEEVRRLLERKSLDMSQDLFVSKHAWRQAVILEALSREIEPQD